MYARLLLAFAFVCSAVLSAKTVNYSVDESRPWANEGRPYHHYYDKEIGLDIENPSYVVVHKIEGDVNPFCTTPVQFVFPDTCDGDDPTMDKLLEAYASGAERTGCYTNFNYIPFSCADHCIDMGNSGGLCFTSYEYVPEKSEWMDLAFCMCQ